MEFNKNLDKSMEWLHKQGAFLTSEFEGKQNTMTISWGAVGYMWRKPVFIALVRPKRYTNEFISKGDSFTVSIPYGDDLKKALSVCGSKSGKTIDKAKEANLEFIESKNVKSNIINGCNMYYECKKLYSTLLKTEDLPEDIREDFYKEGDTHIFYYGEIVESYEK